MKHEIILCQENLRYVRQYILCFSLIEASEKSGLSCPTIRKAENGDPISTTTFKKLCTCYEAEHEKNMVRAAVANGLPYIPSPDSQKEIIEKELRYYREKKEVKNVMLDPDKLEYSNSVLSEQIDYTLRAYPYITSIYKTNPMTENKADYLYQCDARGHGIIPNHNFTVQYKHRLKGDDIIIPARLLAGKDREELRFGFDYNGVKYTLAPVSDIYVITDTKGKHHSYTADEVLGAERFLGDGIAKFFSGISNKCHIDNEGNKFPTNEYMVFISPEKLSLLRATMWFRTNSLHI